MTHLHREIKNHRLGAFVYGFMSGLGLILIIWGLASIIALPSRNSLTYIGLILFGVLLFAGGSCREAYLRGSLTTELNIHGKPSIKQAPPTASSKPKTQSQKETETQPSRQETANSNSLITEQIIDHPVETETHEASVYKQE
jgi:hypothetical protein